MDISIDDDSNIAALEHQELEGHLGKASINIQGVVVDHQGAREGQDSHLSGASIIWIHLYTQFTLEKVRVGLKKISFKK